MRKQILVIIGITILFLSICLLFPVEAKETSHISYYASLLATSNPIYSYEGDLCGTKNSSVTFGRTLEDDLTYLCKITKGGSGGVSGTKQVTIEITNLTNSYCGINIVHITRDEKENKLSNSNYDHAEIYPGNKSFTYNYTYGVDYDIEIYCSGFDSYSFVDNLKDSDMNSENATRQITLNPIKGLEQDLNLQQLSNKITSDNSLNSNTPDFSKLSPTTVTYSKKTTEKVHIMNNNSYCYGTDFTFDETKGTYKLDNISCFKASQKSPIGLYTHFLTYTSNSVGYSSIYKINSVSTTQDGYYNVTYYTSTPATYDTGLYNDNGNYYFRGVVNNNYVKFANNMWRIVRKNSNGSIRLIMDGDIGSTTWNDNYKYDYYMGYDYGTINYQLITPRSSNQTEIIEEQYCYADQFTFDKKTLTYKLAGNIECKTLDGNTYNSVNNKYTLLLDNRTSTSATLYKVISSTTVKSSSGYKAKLTLEPHKVETTDLTYNNTIGSSPHTIYYADDFEIENGLYKLKDPTKITFSYRDSADATRQLIGKYTFNSSSIPKTSSVLYKVLGKASSGSRDIEVYEFASPIHFYTPNHNNPSNPKKMLTDWYNSNLKNSPYAQYLTDSTFCNDTTNGAYSRLPIYGGATPKPTFDCPTGAVYGGSYTSNIGLITADEMVFAGAVPNKVNNNYWLAYNKPFWTMTPYGNYNGYPSMYASTISNLLYNSSDIIESINGLYVEKITVGKASQAYLYAGDPTLAVRPVINVRGSVCVYDKNDGTRGNPYEIITDYNIIDAANNSGTSSWCY